MGKIRDFINFWLNPAKSEKSLEEALEEDHIGPLEAESLREPGIAWTGYAEKEDDENPNELRGKYKSGKNQQIGEETQEEEQQEIGEETQEEEQQEIGEETQEEEQQEI